ncbi:ATP-binding protein [Candidatus Micrarchaeota archaeon]|nr:ATP-binding protein [Candidatus Micrarchaeota archaeon]
MEPEFLFANKEFSFNSTNEIQIPKDPLDQVIGQDEAVKIAKFAAKQRRNLLLVGPPGIGKSLIAQAVSYHLPKPASEVSVLHNPEYPERPIVEVKTKLDLEKETKMLSQSQGDLVSPTSVPSFVAERLGFRCRSCNVLSKPSVSTCPHCGTDKFTGDSNYSPFGDLLAPYFEESTKQERVHTTRTVGSGEEIIVYERAGEKIRVLEQTQLEKLDSLKRKKPRKVIIPLKRKAFVVATGASETELLGDVRHDPYGGHAGIGVQPYLRVVPGAIHESHEGVLFIDEISSLTFIQRYLLTAMQEKKYSIVGRNPHSAGASVKVEDVPCDFILIAASNINDLGQILPPLRSRIIGNGYEVLLDTHMPDSARNRGKLAQFIAQEIRKDGKIPHASFEAVSEIINIAKARAKIVDGADDALTLRLRELGGVVRLSGDYAKENGLIEKEDVKKALLKARNLEEQLRDKYGSMYKASLGDVGRVGKSEGKEIS